MVMVLILRPVFIISIVGSESAATISRLWETRPKPEALPAAEMSTWDIH